MSDCIRGRRMSNAESINFLYQDYIVDQDMIEGAIFPYSSKVSNNNDYVIGSIPDSVYANVGIGYNFTSDDLYKIYAHELHESFYEQKIVVMAHYKKENGNYARVKVID